MMRRSAILLFALCVPALACRRPPLPRPPLTAQLSGDMEIAGLAAPVRVVRDTWGVPHIYAANQHDLFVAQGFVQAQDRLFQMDLWRRSSQGRLSEVLGPNFIERDAMTRRIQYHGDPGAEWASYGPDAKAIAEAFASGVNAWVALARERPPEEFVLAGWKPELWAAADLLNRTDAFTASGDALDEVFRARLVATVGAARAGVLLPSDRSLDVPPDLDVTVVPDLVAEAIRRVGTPPFFLGLAAPVSEGTVRLTPDTTGVVAEGETARAGFGGVRLQPDPVRTLDNPSRRYLVHLNAPGWNVIGATAPWHPGVAAGHNDRIAWPAARIETDTQDVYVEKLNPSNPRQVDEHGTWADIVTEKGDIAIRGRTIPVDFTRETTRHGVIVASDFERHLAFAIRWSGSDPGGAAEMSATAIDRATAVPVPMTVPLVPDRNGWSGAMPVPGWSGTREWSRARMVTPPHPPAVSAPAQASRVVLASLRQHPDRGDALLKALASAPDSLIAQRAAIVDALAEALRDRAATSLDLVRFAHPLAVTDAARRRFNVTARARAGSAADPFEATYDSSDWDRSTAINAPGQSGSPDSAHYADLVKLWSEGAFFPLAFSDNAVQAHATATLRLTPK